MRPLCMRSNVGDDRTAMWIEAPEIERAPSAARRAGAARGPRRRCALTRRRRAQRHTRTSRAGGGVLGSATAWPATSDFSSSGSTEAVNVHTNAITHGQGDQPRSPSDNILGKFDAASDGAVSCIDARAKHHRRTSRFVAVERVKRHVRKTTLRHWRGRVYLRDVLDTGVPPRCSSTSRIDDARRDFSAVIGIGQRAPRAARCVRRAHHRPARSCSRQQSGRRLRREETQVALRAPAQRVRQRHVEYRRRARSVRRRSARPRRRQRLRVRLRRVCRRPGRTIPPCSTCSTACATRAIAIDGSPATERCHARDGDDPDDYRLRARFDAVFLFLEATRVPLLLCDAAAQVSARSWPAISSTLPTS